MSVGTFTFQTVFNMRDDYNSGFTLQQLATKYGISAVQVYGALFALVSGGVYLVFPPLPNVAPSPEQGTSNVLFSQIFMGDFGGESAPFGENDTITVTVPQPLVTATTKIVISLANTQNADHDPGDAVLEGIVGLATNIVPGVSFDAALYPTDNTWGQYNFLAVGTA